MPEMLPVVTLVGRFIMTAGTSRAFSFLKGDTMEKAKNNTKEAVGLIRDARGNARFISEMMQLVEISIREADPSSDRELAKHLMAADGLKNAIDTMDDGVLNFIEEALENLNVAEAAQV